MNNKLNKKDLDILIELFIKKGNTFTWNSSDYAKNSIACKRLMKIFPDMEFFYDQTDLIQKFDCLLGLTGKYWKNELSKRWKEFEYKKLNKPKTYELSDKPVIEIENNKMAPKNILEFIKS